ncbi:pyrroline-5-carboxylate reductase [Rhizobium sp. OAE497]|uniref:pyrroline-5-carboxylate reductase family protein n=1 Tax=Rhizobium sp. OAE497 TaxID=2663796 RepID=UPI0018F3FBAA
MTGIGSNTNSAPRASVLLVGCGNMGFAFLKRWLDRRDATGNDYHVVEPNADLAERAKQAGATVYAGASELPEGFDPIAVFFAVKPDMLAAVAPPYSVMRSAVFVSFAAGVPVAFFEECLGPRSIVRAMPNIPVVAGCGTTVSFSNSFVTPGQKAVVQDLLALGGSSHAVDREELIDVATAVSGSGPAYIFLIVDLIAEVAMQLGLSEELAFAMTKEMVVGAGELALKEPGSLAGLRKQVTSRGGTTEAALAVLNGGNRLADVLREAVTAAHARALELRPASAASS